LGTLYASEAGNNRVTRWSQGAQEGTVIVGEDAQLSDPEGLFFDRQGNFYVADCSKHRVQRFSTQ
jgi:sugar lactone lactonase YvrE